MKRVHSIMRMLSSLSVIAITILYLYFTDTLQYVIVFIRKAINVYDKDMTSIYNFSGNHIEIFIAFINIVIGLIVMGICFKKCYIENDLEEMNY